MKNEKKKIAIGFSRTLGLFDAVALGGCVSIGLLLVVGGLTFQTAGEDAPDLFFLTIFFFLPLVLSLVERASMASGPADFYRLIRTIGSPVLLFVGGWLILGGYISLAAPFAWGVGSRMEIGIQLFFGLDLHTSWIAGGVVVMGGIFELLRSLERGRVRTVLFWGFIIIMLGLSIWLAIKLPPGEWKLEELPPLRNILTEVALLAVLLWGVDVVLSHRDRLRNPSRTSLSSILIVWIATGLLGAGMAFLVLHSPGISYQNWLSKLSPEGERLKLLILAGGSGLCWIGLTQTLSAARRLIDVLSLDGFIPRRQKARHRPSAGLIIFLLILVVIFVMIEIGVPIMLLAGFAALMFLWAAIIVLFPFARVPARKLPEARYPRLPLHPLFPVSSIALALFFTFLLPYYSWPLGLIWLLLGGGYFLLYARREGAAMQRQKFLLGDATAPPSKSVPRVLVLLAGDRSAPSLLRAGAALALAREGELLALRVITLTGQTSMEEVQEIAGKAWERLEIRVGEMDELGLPVLPLVRIAPSVSQGFLSTADEYKADFLIMGWLENDRELDAGKTSTVERVFESTSRPLAIFRGTIEELELSVLVAGQGGANTVAAAELAAALAAAGGGKAVYLTISRRRTGDGDPDPLPIGEGLDLERRVVQADNVKTGILNEAVSSDLLLMGAPIDHLLDRSYLGGIPVEVARSRERPTIVVKAAEHRRAFWLRRLWEFVSRLLPDLSVRERAEVYRQMRNDARADTDFFTLIVLSSAIAILGLILNSGAVIIGAMLVAPLMSPMMAIAHGIVQGNMIMIRRGLISTFKGVAISIGVGIVMTMVVNPYQPTVEILARSGPTLLDLLVALASGAAGAYAVSRRSVAAALPGVAISVALVPPLCVVGYGIGSANFRIAGGAFILFMTNLAAIVLVSAFVFLLVGFRPTRSHQGRQVIQAVLVSLLSVFILVVPLWLETGTVSRIERIEARIDTIFREELAGEAILLSLEIKREGGEYVIDAVALSFQNEDGAAERLEETRLLLSREIGAPVRINLTAAPASHFQAAGEGPVEESHSGMLPVGEEEPDAPPEVSEDEPAQPTEQTEE